MTVQVLVCNADGTQHMEARELPDNWFDAVSEQATVPAIK